ncbi:hypothetical protein ACIPYS_17670 [Kitasatospora sp. NPDC089913]|uniref:hypothetical protein n=1 Tax=Kitasatospora sp. NPDC089913 TaxID=3364080 RepID=UPI00382FE4D1
MDISLLLDDLLAGYRGPWHPRLSVVLWQTADMIRSGSQPTRDQLLVDLTATSLELQEIEADWPHAAAIEDFLRSQESFYSIVATAATKFDPQQAQPEVQLAGILSSAAGFYSRSRGLKVLRRGVGRPLERAVAEAGATTNRPEQPWDFYGPFTGLGFILFLHEGWLQAQAERLGLELLLLVLWDALPVPCYEPLLEEPRAWSCVCGSERLAAPLVPRGPTSRPLPAFCQQGHRSAWSLAA